jgi:hypothetical protein
MRFGNYALVAGCVLAAIAPAARGAEPIRPEQFRALHTLIKPKAAEEKWEQIPWLASLWEARQRAAREGKPILLWEMDGHPLGCV